MSRRKKVLKDALRGASDVNIRFEELRQLLLYLGFGERIKGSHHIFWLPRFAEILNLQPLQDGKAKAYQVKQVWNLILEYRLGGEDAEI